jgi:hypothetical protein
METNDLGEKFPEEILFQDFDDDEHNVVIKDIGTKNALVKAMERIIEHFDLRFKKHYSTDDYFIQIKLVTGEKYESEMQ